MNELEVLDWEGLSPIYYEGLVRKKEIGDGSCFFHCIADAFYEPYQMGQKNKKDFVSNLRKELSILLSSKNNKGIKWYDTLSRGTLAEFSKNVTSFSLASMVSILDSNEFVDNRFNEFVSNIFNKDIYIINYETMDIYITGNDDDILYKNRDSIVLIWYNKNHYDLAGIMQKEDVIIKLKTLFEFDHPFISIIRNRVKSLRK